MWAIIISLQDNNNDDDDTLNSAPNDAPQNLTNVGNTDMTYDISNSSQGLSFANDTAMDLTMFAGDGLVAQPNKVAKIDIGYAKTAKKMDVKKLKQAMWSLLTKDDNGKVIIYCCLTHVLYVIPPSSGYPLFTGQGDHITKVS